MLDRFDSALAFVLRWEGGYSDAQADHGGATNHGITQRVYDAFRSALNDPLRPVREIEDGEVKAIYRADYWLRARCDSCPAPLDLVLFDSAVNSGVTQATRWMQRALGVTADGVAGPHTLAAIAACIPRVTARVLIDHREVLLRTLGAREGQGKFLAGWLNRTTALRAAAGVA